MPAAHAVVAKVFQFSQATDKKKIPFMGSFLRL
ncbi:hypothetical protein EV200_104191 [Pedobacter psychrotolerans]|uniref:Uncharacterized protein n=1 Tax=Pedobacter psychrotolerans TaxID=1843235 RepID=A0A4V2RZC4_9SPHI|nr:hypothetical protein EV200_104191 [Pedobacter psychrotolerans]